MTYQLSEWDNKTQDEKFELIDQIYDIEEDRLIGRMASSLHTAMSVENQSLGLWPFA